MVTTAADDKGSERTTRARIWLVSVLEQVRAARSDGFCGLGLIAYAAPLRMSVLSLVPDGQEPPLPSPDPAETAAFLCRLSGKQQPFHDGFHLVDADKLRITHVSHFVAPSVPSQRPKNLPAYPVGARLMTALLVSLQPFVVLSATMNGRGHSILFERGVMLQLSK
jgi:hypothetical protein